MKDIQKIDQNSSLFPERLLEIVNPPEQLYYVGNPRLLQERSVAIVGSRRYSLYGMKTAEMLGRHLAQAGIPVVSGLAYGIDAFSHTGVLQENGMAIGVLGTGHDCFYPKKNEKLFREVCQKGVVVSEYEPDFPGRAYSFPARNRIISALSECVIVVEAGLNSGSLITAQYAAEQGRDVYAVPGNINSQFSVGTNLLIRDGARPLIVIDDLIRDLGMEPVRKFDELPEMGEDEAEIVDLLRRRGGMNVNEISHILNKNIGKVSAIMTILEIKGIIITHGGKNYLAK